MEERLFHFRAVHQADVFALDNEVFVSRNCKQAATMLS